MQQSGYSGTPLPKKLGLQDGQKAVFIGLPETQTVLKTARAFRFVELLSDPAELDGKGFDYIHLFSDQAAVIKTALTRFVKVIDPDGMIWVSWPKKASKVPTDVTEDVIRNCALTGVLVDVKVCAIDEIWSGLKLVVRKEHRAQLAKEQQGMA